MSNAETRKPRDIEEIIAELRSTPEGEAAWQQAIKRKKKAEAEHLKFLRKVVKAR
jgi:hypothetical protein